MTGTATTRHNGRAASINLAVDYHRSGQFSHRDCGGKFRLYDIEVDS